MRIPGSAFSENQQVMIRDLLYNDTRRDVGGVVKGLPRGVTTSEGKLDVSVGGTILRVDESKLCPWEAYWQLKKDEAK